MKDHKFTGFQSLRIKEKGFHSRFEGLGIQAALNVLLRRKSTDGGVGQNSPDGVHDHSSGAGVCNPRDGVKCEERVCSPCPLASSTFYILHPEYQDSSAEDTNHLPINSLPIRRFSFGSQLGQSLDNGNLNSFVKNQLTKPETLQAHRSKSLSQIDSLNMAKQESPAKTADSGGCSPDEARGKHRASRKVPSTEFFSVTLEVVDEQNYELIPAQCGVTLRDALHSLLDKRGLDLDSVNLYLDCSNTPLPLQFDTYRLAGNHIVIKAKESYSTEQSPVVRTNSTGSTSRLSVISSRDEKRDRKATGSQRGRRGAVMVSTEELPFDPSGASPPNPNSLSGGGDGTWKSRGKSQPSSKKIFSNPFKTDKEKMEILSDLLNHYSQRGIPELYGLLTFPSVSSSSDENVFNLEEHWSSLVDNSQELSKRTKNQQDAIWELLQTEVFYIHRLKVITDLFLAVLCNLQNELLLNEVETEKLFGNIRDVYGTNYNFWVSHLLPMLQETRATRQPLDPLLMKEGFLKFESLFQPYIKYCLDQSLCLQYVKERYKDNKLFKAYVAWCETRKDCEKLRLVDLLVKPMQRLTKYSLLLKAIHKKTDNEEHKNALLEMNACVEHFVCGVDGTLRQRYEQERLATIINRIESYDVIDCNNDELEKVLKDYCSLDLTYPMPGCGVQQSRQLLLEGSGLKLKDSSSGKVDVHCFLFTDMLLICKSMGKKSGDKVRIIRQPYVVDQLLVQELKDGTGLLLLYINEFKVATSAFILYMGDPKLWADNIRKAQELFREAKSLATERPELGFLRHEDDDEEIDFPSIALLVASKSPYSSSHSSLVHSHSGSVDMSDPSSATAACPPPSNLTVSSGASQGKAVSIELGDLRNPSLAADDDGMKYRAKSMEANMPAPICVTVTSPRPERRKFFLQGAGGNTTLSLNVPTFSGDAPTIQVPMISPTPKNLSARLTCSTHMTSPTNCNKPPLVKTKPNTGLTTTHSAPASQGPSPVHSLENEMFLGSLTFSESNTPDSEDESSRKLNVKRNARVGRRYHTADSIENYKSNKDNSIHKRLSWNYGQSSQGAADQKLHNKHISQCLSNESVYSSSGVSSIGSAHFSIGSTDYDLCFEGSDILEEDTSQIDPEAENALINGETDCCSPITITSDTDSCSSTVTLIRRETVGPPGSRIKIDVSEVKDGISSVQIAPDSTLPGGKPSKADLRRMKEFFLTSCSLESSEV